jgi:uncharacterized membrane protein
MMYSKVLLLRLISVLIYLSAKVQGFAPPSFPRGVIHKTSRQFPQKSFKENPQLSIQVAARDTGRLRALPFHLPLIGADDAWGNWAVLAGTATAAQVLGRTTAVGRLLGPPVSAMAMTFFFATVGVLNPGGTVAAKSLQLLSLQMATPLILLGADLRDAGARCGPLLISFAAASAATTIACVLGWKLTGASLTAALGGDGLVIAAALLAKNVGGGINYVAVCRSLNASPTAVAAGLCVDNIFALVYFPITSALASGLPDIEATANVEESVAKTPVVEETFSVQTITTVLGLSALLLWLGEQIGGTVGALPICTLLTVALASNAPTRWMAPLQPAANSLGTVGLYFFFATAGSPGIAVAESVQASLLPLGLFLTTLYAVHGLILAACHKIWGKRFPAFQPQRLLVASSAAIGGPATSVALAQAAGWESLTVPSLLVGNIGYAIASFCGLAYYAIFK